MSSTTPEALTRSTQKTQEWLHSLEQRLGMLPNEDDQATYRVLRAFLQTLRDRMTPNEAADVSAQLPMFLRGVFFEGWRPEQTPQHYQDPDMFLREFAEKAQVSSGNIPDLELVRAASSVLAENISDGQYRHVLDQLPESVRAMVAAPA